MPRSHSNELIPLGSGSLDETADMSYGSGHAVYPSCEKTLVIDQLVNQHYPGLA